MRDRGQAGLAGGRAMAAAGNRQRADRNGIEQSWSAPEKTAARARLLEEANRIKRSSRRSHRGSSAPNSSQSRGGHSSKVPKASERCPSPQTLDPLLVSKDNDAVR